MPPNFHPTVTPGIIFDSSASEKIDLDDENSEENLELMDSRRNLVTPNIAFGNLNDENFKSRN
jgi:hypothetical protein